MFRQILYVCTSIVTIPIMAGDIPASNFFQAANTTVMITPKSSDTVVFDELENNKYFLNGRDLVITANRIRVKGNAKISGFATPSPDASGQGGAGPAGQSFGQAGNCNTGAPGGGGGGGGNGPKGADGQRGSIIRLDIGRIDGPGLISFSARGQDGGKGGPGGPGGQGGHGETGGNSRSGIGCICGGGNGGQGGNGGLGGQGGTGGTGGDGGTVVLSPRTKQVRQRLSFEINGGDGGAGGAGGSGGAPGDGGGGGGGGGFCGGGHGAGPGAPLGAGQTGLKGPSGKDGLIIEF